MKLSILIAAYNGDKYLDKCIKSCINQDMNSDDYEVIIVNDGSTDRTREIAESWAFRHHNIVVINRVNGGLTEARNTGLRAAKGEYVWFMDGDDYLCEHSIGRLMEVIYRDSLDILCFNYNIVYPEGKESQYSPSFNQYNKVYTGADFFCRIKTPPFFVFRTIYRQNFLRSNNLMFYSGLWYDDIEFMPRAFSLASRVEYVNLHPYNYFQRVGSISKSRHSERNTGEYLKIADSLYYFAENHLEKDSHIYFRLMSIVYHSLFTSLAFYKKKVISLSDYKEKPYFPLSTKFVSKKDYSRIKLANFSLRLYIYWHQNRSRLIQVFLDIQRKFRRDR